jgi:hypothetical protein
MNRRTPKSAKLELRLQGQIQVSITFAVLESNRIALAGILRCSQSMSRMWTLRTGGTAGQASSGTQHPAPGVSFWVALLACPAVLSDVRRIGLRSVSRSCSAACFLLSEIGTAGQASSGTRRSRLPCPPCLRPPVLSVLPTEKDQGSGVFDE